MANSLEVWTLLLILYQTIICITISWFTLECQFAPKSTELRELTLVKLLYLYDPKSCGRIYFYNFTFKGQQKITYSNIMWPVINPVASSFRRKMQISLSMHIIWLFLSIVNFSQGQRSCGFYMTLLPFTLAGIATLAMDIIFMVLFLEDTYYTKTEVGILKYIDRDYKLHWISQEVPLRNNTNVKHDEDTSWISLLFAYGSCRGVVQWIINFWVIKDNYFEGEISNLYTNPLSDFMHERATHMDAVYKKKNLIYDGNDEHDRIV